MDELEKRPSESAEQKSKTREFLLEWGFNIQTFESRARQSMENARGDLSEVTGALRQTLATTRQTLVDLHEARQPVATELKSGFERAWDEIETAFANARKKMREPRETAVVADEKKNTRDSSET